MGEHRIDVVGDVHGQLEALLALGRHLGYEVERGWRHPDGRALVFLGDLVDRGPASLRVVELVLSLVDEGRAVCLMGNHEYNLVGFALGVEKPKSSNRETVADLGARPGEWRSALERLRYLPLAIDLPELRLVHAVWHLEAFRQVEDVLAPSPRTGAATTAGWLMDHVALQSPFDSSGLRPGLPSSGFADQDDAPHEILLKGYEARAAEPFDDADGKTRDRERVTWWRLAAPPVPSDKLTIFGHYWNVPPIPGEHDELAPPFASGTPALGRWQHALAWKVPLAGTVQVPRAARFACVDYNGVVDGGGGSCVGAFRWPEHQVAWVRLPGAESGRLGSRRPAGG